MPVARERVASPSATSAAERHSTRHQQQVQAAEHLELAAAAALYYHFQSTAAAAGQSNVTANSPKSPSVTESGLGHQHQHSSGDHFSTNNPPLIQLSPSLSPNSGASTVTHSGYGLRDRRRHWSYTSQGEWFSWHFMVLIH